MGSVRFITRTGTLTGTMPRVYVSIHPDDFDSCFRMICGDIFMARDNCAIFYDADPGNVTDEEELTLVLSEMRLIVVPVSRKLLSGACRAMKAEIPFGVKNNIPVLPILVERDEGGELTAAFNRTEIFGGLQFLNRYENDPTALRYEDKLAGFLESVLISEEENRRIRNEFSSKIFLSYRKKDRKYAQELMRRIHKVDVCRDTAIWYDEYLIPGESFDSNIMEALNECDVFVMSVTPSFAEPGNYVADHEYPDAVRKGKPIAAADMIRSGQVSPDSLEELYPGIKSLWVDPEDEDSLGVALKKHLMEDAGISEGKLLNNEGEHLYYIALAYKNGIRAESDPARAAELFRMSAENGCCEAYLRLIRMERTGDGVERDYDAALECAEEAENNLKPREGDSFRTDHVLACVYEEKGHIFTDLREKEEAFAAYRDSYELRRKMHARYREAPLKDYAESMITLASSLFASGASDKAKNLADEFVSESGVFSGGDAEPAAPQETPDNTENEIGILRVKARISSLLSTVCIQLRHHTDALAHLKRRLDLCERIEAATGDTGDLEALGNAYLSYADFVKNTNAGEANLYTDRYSRVKSRLDEFGGNRHKTINDAVDTVRIADNCLLRASAGDSGMLDKAKALYSEAEEISSGLTEGSDRYNALVLTATVYKRYGEIGKASGGSVKSVLEHFEKALGICCRAEREYRNDPQLLHMKSGLLDQIGAIYLGIGDLTAATERFTDALETDMMASRIIKDTASKHNLAKSHMRLSEINRRRGHQPVADVNTKSAVRILEPLCRETDDYRILEDLAAAYFRLGISDRLRGEERLDYCRKAAQSYKQLTEMTNGAEEYVQAYASARKLIEAIETD